MFKKFFKKKEEINIDEVFITFRVKKHIKKDFKTIGEEYIDGKIIDKDFFVDNDEINDYFYDLLKGTEHTFIIPISPIQIITTVIDPFSSPNRIEIEMSYMSNLWYQLTMVLYRIMILPNNTNIIRVRVC